MLPADTARALEAFCQRRTDTITPKKTNAKKYNVLYMIRTLIVGPIVHLPEYCRVLAASLKPAKSERASNRDSKQRVGIYKSMKFWSVFVTEHIRNPGTGSKVTDCDHSQLRPRNCGDNGLTETPSRIVELLEEHDICYDFRHEGDQHQCEYLLRLLTHRVYAHLHNSLGRRHDL